MFATGELAIAWYAQSIVNTADDRLQTMSGDEINQVHELGTAAEQHALSSPDNIGEIDLEQHDA